MANRKSIRPNLKFIDLFAGIGGFRLAFQSTGAKCVFASEWNRFAAFTYETNFRHRPAGDITQIPASQIPNHDILTAGFPCQPFSIAGVSKHNALGNEHGFRHATQGTLFFDVARIIEQKKPKAFVLENVKNLLSHDKKRTFSVIKDTLENELGYKIHDKLIDAQKVVPQHRERIYIVGFRADIDDSTFEFPRFRKKRKTLASILETEVDPKYTLTNHLWKYLKDYAEKHRSKGNGFGYSLVDLHGITRTLSARYYKDGSEILIPQDNKNPRRLTPRECARLMGYRDTFRIEVSDTQAYKQFGNSVVVPVVTAIARKVVTCLSSEANRKIIQGEVPYQLPLIDLNSELIFPTAEVRIESQLLN